MPRLGDPTGAEAALAKRIAEDEKLVADLRHTLERHRREHERQEALRERERLKEQERLEEQARLQEQERLREQERRKAEFWHGLSGRAFERELAALYRRRGHAVRHVGGRGDDGIDLWISVGDGEVPVQCKRHNVRLVPRVVREFLGACRAANRGCGVLVSTGGLTAAARRFAQANSILVMDVSDLVRLSEDVAPQSAPPSNDPPDSVERAETIDLVEALVASIRAGREGGRTPKWMARRSARGVGFAMGRFIMGSGTIMGQGIHGLPEVLALKKYSGNSMPEDPGWLSRIAPECRLEPGNIRL